MDLYSESADFYTIPIDTNTADNPDFDLEVYIALGDDDLVYILHDEKFQKELSWIEYDIKEKRIDFIMEDGDLRHFGISIKPAYEPYLKTMSSIAIAHVNNGKYIDGNMYPLMIHHN